MKSFIRKKTIKGHEYLYEVTPYYDPDTGKWRQKTKYLGKNVDGEPVKKDRGGKVGQIYDIGEYIPAYWAIKTHKIMESLLTSCSPDETATVILLTINRLINPCPPANLSTWLESTYLSKLIPGADFNESDLLQVLQKISDRPVAEVFSRMFASINDLSNKRFLFTLRLHDIAELMKEKGSGLFSEDILERELGVRIHYDPDKQILAGFDAFQFQHAVIEDTIDQISSGKIPEGIIVPHWDYLSPSLMLRIVNAGCSFITRTDVSYGPVSSHISSRGEQMEHPANIRYYKGEACYIRPLSISYGKNNVHGYILHDIRREQADRLAFHKNLQNIRDLVQETKNYPGTVDELLNESAGSFRKYFIIDDSKEVPSIRTDQEEVHQANKRLGRSCVLYRGDFTWEECFTLADMRGNLEQQMSSFISELERDFKGYRIERIRKGIFFICFLAVLIRELIANRLISAQIPEVTSFEALLTVLRPVHVIKSYQPLIFPYRFTKTQKAILSYFGGIPPLKGD
ncbi:MAG: hypothetical protein GX268_12200 [Methanomicrobiales archaeon]|nr:hypothetical protein [Methanomicrobiales archaeon]